mmetsp:Transcript_110436/g.235908  ORF Transcript_110436/g.235908 Transcript_110436/m.235908 type:complete len:391 (-) Transcript_110436:158-1330(-)
MRSPTPKVDLLRRLTELLVESVSERISLNAEALRPLAPSAEDDRNKDRMAGADGADSADAEEDLATDPEAPASRNLGVNWIPAFGSSPGSGRATSQSCLLSAEAERPPGWLRPVGLGVRWRRFKKGSVFARGRRGATSASGSPPWKLIGVISASGSDAGETNMVAALRSTSFFGCVVFDNTWVAFFSYPALSCRARAAATKSMPTGTVGAARCSSFRSRGSAVFGKLRDGASGVIVLACCNRRPAAAGGVVTSVNCPRAKTFPLKCSSTTCGVFCSRASATTGVVRERLNVGVTGALGGAFCICTVASPRKETRLFRGEVPLPVDSERRVAKLLLPPFSPPGCKGTDADCSTPCRSAACADRALLKEVERLMGAAARLSCREVRRGLVVL